MLVLVSAGALEDGLRQYNFTDIFSYVINSFRPQAKKYSALNHFRFLVVLCVFAFSLSLCTKESQ